MAEAEKAASTPEWAVALDRIWANCRKPGWDSYGAQPVTEVAVHVAGLVLASMQVVPTADGGIEVDFAGEALSFRFGPDGLLDELYGSRADMVGWLSRKSSVRKPGAGNERS